MSIHKWGSAVVTCCLFVCVCKVNTGDHMESKSKAQLERLIANNPCYDESIVSLKCLDANGQELCQKEIANYKKCKQFWYDIYNFRKLHGIRPFQPEVDERKRIKEKYLQSRNFKQICDAILQENKSKQ